VESGSTVSYASGSTQAWVAGSTESGTKTASVTETHTGVRTHSGSGHDNLRIHSGADPFLQHLGSFPAFSFMGLSGDGRRAQGERVAGGEVICEVGPQSIEQNAA
jgi:hypothetical protein